MSSVFLVSTYITFDRPWIYIYNSGVALINRGGRHATLNVSFYIMLL